MTREELLDLFKGKISDYSYNVLIAWTKKREYKFFFFKRKFDVRPSGLKGYCFCTNSTSLDFIILS